jgi:hypothetical protein
MLVQIGKMNQVASCVLTRSVRWARQEVHELSIQCFCLAVLLLRTLAFAPQIYLQTATTANVVTSIVAVLNGTASDHLPFASHVWLKIQYCSWNFSISNIATWIEGRAWLLG